MGLWIDAFKVRVAAQGTLGDAASGADPVQKAIKLTLGVAAGEERAGDA